MLLHCDSVQCLSRACVADDEEDTKEEFDPEVYFMREVSATVLRAIKERIDEVRGDREGTGWEEIGRKGLHRRA